MEVSGLAVIPHTRHTRRSRGETKTIGKVGNRKKNKVNNPCPPREKKKTTTTNEPKLRQRDYMNHVPKRTTRHQRAKGIQRRIRIRFFFTSNYYLTHSHQINN